MSVQAREGRPPHTNINLSELPRSTMSQKRFQCTCVPLPSFPFPLFLHSSLVLPCVPLCSLWFLWEDWWVGFY